MAPASFPARGVNIALMSSMEASPPEAITGIRHCSPAHRYFTTSVARSLNGAPLSPPAPIASTFSAGVTRYRPGEPLEAALERADEALYEAKRTGKNRTCIG